MLWANTEEIENGQPTGASVTPEDWQTPRDDWPLRAFDACGQASIRGDCEDFVTANWPDLRTLDPAQCGHDFALTRNGHGAGFWDRGLGERGDSLTAASKPYGESSAWYDVNDSAEVHLNS
jgi:hypothetical protein